MMPDKFFNNTYVVKFSSLIGILSTNQLLTVFTISFAVLVFISGGIRILLLWLTTRFSYDTGADLSLIAYRRTLYQSYQIHLSRNSSDVISSITNKVNGVAFGILLSTLNVVSSSILLIAITLTMIFINAKIAFIASFSFGVSYLIITFIFRMKLRANSKLISIEQTRVIKALQEGLGGIRDVLLDSTQDVYCDIYSKADKPLRRATGNNLFIAQGPRYLMETFGILLIVLLSFYLSKTPGGIAMAMPTLGALALSAQRLLPSLQMVYGSWASIVGSIDALIDTLKMLEIPIHSSHLSITQMEFKEKIAFKDVCFKYSELESLVLNKLSFEIPKGTKVGFIGSTGSGKSTTLDILMGLLTPNSGNILIDGHVLNEENRKGWQKNLAHVPQSIFLADTTIMENIAFGVPFNEINIDRVKLAAKQAQISDFIEAKALGYQSLIGERGVQLSGGQRQRIGIARALYKDANILIFDEATSALDNSTEQSVMNSIENLSNDFTIILIAHRLSTLKHCDFVVELENGMVKDIGTYERIVQKNEPQKNGI